MKLYLLIGPLASAALSAQGQTVLDRYLTDPLTYTNIVTSADQVSLPRDLDFKPNSNELWVMNRGTASSGGSMVIVKNAGLPGQTDVYKKDTHSSHFMIQASAMAFSPNGEWAAVSEVQNTASPTSTFMGPALWSADPNIFATVFQNNWVSGLPLGSHLDMLHQSPYAMGIAADSLKVYWVMDGHFGNIVRYDFVQDHGPGYDDHGAGKIWRYTDVPVTRVANIPSHMVLDKANGWLYFIDGGAKQIKRLNVNSGSITGNLTVPSTSNEPLASYKKVEGASVEIVDTWVSGQPCGIDYVQDRLIVSDNTSGDIHLYDVSATPTHIGMITTGQAGIMGLKVGPDGRIWFVNYTGNKVVRIDPSPLTDDAAVTAIVAPVTVAANANFYSTASDICASSMAPVVTLANKGSNDLMMADIHFHIDGGTATMFSWTGMLAPGATTDVTLPSVALTNGAHQLNVWAEMPNGVEDTNPMNNELQGSFRVIDPVVGIPFNEGFTSTTFPPTGWNYVHFNPNNKMTRNTVGGFGLSAGCIKMDHFSGSMDITGQLDYLMMPRVDLSGATPGTTLDFAVAYKRYNTTLSERLMVKVSTDCGGTWSTLYDKEGAVLATTTPGTGAFTPTAAQWRTDYVDISSVLGQSDVLFMFVTESNFGNNMYLDDVRIANTVGIDESGVLSFGMYPNPSTGQTTLTMPAAVGAADVKLYDATGRLAWSAPAGSVSGTTSTLDLVGLAPGTYTVKVRNGNVVGSRTLVVLDAR